MFGFLVNRKCVAVLFGSAFKTCSVKALSCTLAGDVQTCEIQSSRCLEGGSAVEVKWSDGECSRFHSSWLRFNCRCAFCTQGYHAQINWNFKDLPDPLKLSGVKEHEDKLQFMWENEDSHVGEMSLDWLKKNSYSGLARKQRSLQRTTQPHIGKSTLPEVQYSDVVRSQKGLWQWLVQIGEHGVSLMKNVPTEETHVLQVTRRIGPVMNTVYGETFEVLSSPVVTDQSEVNIALSEAWIHLHMDLPYYSLPPGLQLLHCLRFDPEIVGGESTLLDGFHVAEEMRRLHPEEFDTLVRVPTTFTRTYTAEGEIPVKMTHQRPHIMLNPDGELTSLAWAPSYSGLLSVPEEDVEPYFKAYRTLAKLINHSSMQKTVALEPGDLICFNNLRFLHGREGFKSNGGVRHLKGTYVNIDEYKNAFQVLSQTVGDGRPCKRLGTSCLL